MKKTLLGFLVISLTFASVAQYAVSAEEKLSPGEKYALKYPMPKDPFVGFYKGEMSGTKKYPLGNLKDIYAEVFRGENGYRIKILSDIMSRSDEYNVVDGLKADDGIIHLNGEGNLNLKGKITPDSIEAEGAFRNDKIKLSLRKLTIVSPTMGAKAPSDAVVLDKSKWFMNRDGSPSNWEWKDGEMTTRCFERNEKGKGVSSSVKTEVGFGALRMHCEFKIPAEYDIAVGQGRGNSGLFIGPYEVQILESFGAPAWFDQCGSIYRQSPPKVNACLPPEEWQTYDIEFHPAVYEGDKLVKYPTITVWQNGVRIHNGEEILGDTSKFPQFRKDFKHPVSDLKIGLQDHSHPVKFRNIWVQPL